MLAAGYLTPLQPRYLPPQGSAWLTFVHVAFWQIHCPAVHFLVGQAAQAAVTMAPCWELAGRPWPALIGTDLFLQKLQSHHTSLSSVPQPMTFVLVTCWLRHREEGCRFVILCLQQTALLCHLSSQFHESTF